MIKQFNRLTWKAGLLAIVASVLIFTIVLAASGDLDATFSGDGLTTDYVVPSAPERSDIAQSVALRSDGSIVVAGSSSFDFAVTRYVSDGTLDSLFSGDGRLITNFGGIDEAYGVAVQSNGKIVVVGKTCAAGGSNCNVALARYNGDGSLDKNFSGDGKQITDFGGLENGSFGGIAIQSNGRIVVAGYASNGKDYDFAVYRYLSNGTLDTSFSGDGRARFGFGSKHQDYASDLIIQSDGKILVAGSTRSANTSNKDFAIARLNANGSLDKTFSGDGKQITNFGADDSALGLALQSNGKIVVAGNKYTGNQSVALVRYNKNGSLDTTFNGTGKLVFSVLSGLDSQANDVIVQSDGKIVLLGATNNTDTSSFDFALVRLNSDGTFDTAFSDDGIALIDFGGDDYGNGLALQIDGNYVLAGFINDSVQKDFAVSRVLH